MLLQEVGQRLGQRALLVRQRNRRAQAVETQHLAQHAPEFWAQQVAALGKHGRQVGAIPLQPLPTQASLRHLHRKRHVRACSRHPQLVQQGNQTRVGPLVEDQKTGVDPVPDQLPLCIWQFNIQRVRMPAKIRAGLVQGHMGMCTQAVCRGQA